MNLYHIGCNARTVCLCRITPVASLFLLCIVQGCVFNSSEDEDRAVENRLRVVLERTLSAFQEGHHQDVTNSWLRLAQKVSGDDPVYQQAVMLGSDGSKSPIAGNSDVTAWLDPDGNGVGTALLVCRPVKKNGESYYIGIRFDGQIVRMVSVDVPL